MPILTPSRSILVLLVSLVAIGATAIESYDYGNALDKTLLFFEAQRSGKLPSTQRIKWRGDSGLGDGYAQGVNLVGGYYDAGDNVKFGLSMAFSVTMLSWGAIDFKEDFMKLNQMEHILEAIRWGTDYFLKCHPQPNVLWGQIGDGASDHDCWLRPEEMTTSRTAYKLDPKHPGSDLAGETAAALAAASLAFRPFDAAYANLLLVHAKQIFSFADRFRGLFTDSIGNAKEFYNSSGYYDELLWGATWLHRATNKDYYLKYVVDNCNSFGGIGWAVQEFSWDNKYAGVQILLSKVLLEGRAGIYASTLQKYQTKADYFTCACMQKNDGDNVNLTPGGLIHVHEWNNLQYTACATFLLTIYSEYLSKSKSSIHCPDSQIQPQEILNFAKSQVDYILGKNPNSLSYVVGYGKHYPLHVHHRGASIPPVSLLKSSVGCIEGYKTWYKRNEANPNIIYGALVGGPNKRDEFFDDRSDHKQTEPTLSGTAPLLGVLSRFHTIYSSGNGKRTIPYHKSQVVPVEFVHSITNTWIVGTKKYYRHEVDEEHLTCILRLIKIMLFS